MEAAILATYPGIHLPDRWPPGTARDRTAPSWRRLVTLVRHLPPGNPLERALHPEAGEWDMTHQLIDDTRRAIVGALGVKDPVPHPMAPHAKPQGVTPERVAVLAAAQARAERFNAR